MAIFKSNVKLDELDKFNFYDIHKKYGAWNYIRYPVNARLEFELVKQIEANSGQEVRDRFKFRPNKEGDQDIHVDWTQFYGVYIPACYLEQKTNPEACFDPTTLEYIRRTDPQSLKDKTCVPALFARDDLNALFHKFLDEHERSDPRVKRNTHLGEIVYGGPQGIPSEEKLRRLFEDPEYRSCAAECARAMVENASIKFDKYGKKIKNKRLRKLIGILIDHYQSEIGEPQIPST